MMKKQTGKMKLQLLFIAEIVMRRISGSVRQAALWLILLAAFGASAAGVARAQGCPTITVTNPAQTVYELHSQPTSPSYTSVFTQTGGVGNVVFSLNSGTLPSGLTIAANGAVNGNTLQSGSFTFSVKATDSNGCVGTGQNITITNSSLGDPDLSVMIALRDTYGWGNAFAWDTTTSPCPNTTKDINWNGVTCQIVNGQRRVTIIIAACGNIKLNQNLPPVLANLTALKTFDLRSCNMNGNASSGGLDSLVGLTKLRLDNNPALSGTITDIFPNGLTPTRFPNLIYFDLTGTGIGGQIPAGVMQYTNSTELRLERARFSGTLPVTGNASKNIRLNGNALEGALPDYIRNATGTVLVRYNKFDVAGTPAGNIDTLDTLWRTTQTVPPTNVQATAGGAGTATVSWTPIAYTGDGGYYEVLSSQSAGGPYTSRGTTAATGGKTASGLTVSGLPGGTNYFVVRTFTPAHPNNPNDLTSINSAETSAGVQPPLVVNTTADNGTNGCDAAECTLREAIAAANATTAADTITFAIPPSDANCANGVCTIALTTGELGIANAATAGTLLISNATGAMKLRVSGNNASRVFRVNGGGNLTINNMTITGGNADTGGGIYNSGTLTITSSTISGNSANGDLSIGGGIFNSGGTVTITNSTLSGNSAAGGDGNGGGILNSNGALTITNSTITSNSAAGGLGGGVYGAANVRNTIIAGNTAGFGPDFNGAFNSQGYNLIGNTQGTNFSGDTTTNLTNQNARLAPLGFYGGQTQTHALLSTSPAVNAGNSATSPATDQRGASRVGNVDIGAFELNNSSNGGNSVAVLPNARQTVPYNFVIAQNNGAFTYSLTSGALPNGITLATNPAQNGAVSLSSTPTANGTFNFSVTASDGTNSNITDYTLMVLPPLNTAPTISAALGITRQQGTAASNSNIATVSDAETAAGSLTVTATSVPTGITVSAITNTNGTITANVAADCTATAGVNTVGLTVTDGGATATANLTINVTASAATLSGQVTFSGNGLAGVTITLTKPDSTTTTTLTAAAGNYTFPNLAPGSYTVTPSKTNFTVTPASRAVTVSGTAQTANFTATATANASGPNGAALISEFRLQGPVPAASPAPAPGDEQGQLDEFIELYNNTDAPVSLAGYTLDTSPGFSIQLPSSANIPARGHYLIANSGGYSLSPYATPDLTYSGFDLPPDAALVLLSPANLIVDAAGFTTSPSTYREGAGLTPVTTTGPQSSFVRNLNTSLPRDTGDNAADFVLVATDPSAIPGPTAILGAPAPENAASPVQRNRNFNVSLPAGVAASLRTTTPVTNGSLGTLSLRRRFTNLTGQAITKLRFRVTDTTTINSPLIYSPQAQVRALQATLAGLAGTTVQATTLEHPPLQPTGGGVNSSLVVGGSLILSAPLPNNASVEVEFLLGVMQSGNYRFIITIEAAP